MSLLEQVDSNLNTLLGISVAFLILTWISAGLRFYVRARLLRSFGYDDWFLLASLVGQETRSLRMSTDSHRSSSPQYAVLPSGSLDKSIIFSQT